MVDLRAIEQIMNPVTGQWVRFLKPVIVTGGDIDSFIAGYQQRMVDEWTEQRAMSGAQLNAIHGRHAAATPGRWYIDPNRQPKWLIRSDHPNHGDICHVSFAEPTALIPKPSGPNLRFILNAHRDVAALLAEVERLSSPGAPARDQFKPLPQHDPAAGTHNFPVLDPLTVPHVYGPCPCGQRMGETDEQPKDGAE